MQSKISELPASSGRRSATWLLVSALAATTGLGACSASRPNTAAVSTTTSTLSATSTALVTTIADVTTTVIPATTEPATTTTLEPTTTTEAPTTTTIMPLVTEGAVVLVANATNLSGGGSKLTAQLKAAGFHLDDPTNAAGDDEFLDVSKIYVLPGGEAVAASLAIVMGGIAVVKMPVPAPINDANVGLKDATVVIMLGRDLVGKKPPGLRNR